MKITISLALAHRVDAVAADDQIRGRQRQQSGAGGRGDMGPEKAERDGVNQNDVDHTAQQRRGQSHREFIERQHLQRRRDKVNAEREVMRAAPGQLHRLALRIFEANE